MRIYGNRQLKTLPGKLTRPTSARVREALFNIWQGEIAGCRWLDICAGSGSMGAEALCRGASEVVGIEQSGRACGIIKENWQKVARSEQKYRVIRGDAIERLKNLAGEKFDRIYFDPPYASNLYQPVLEAIANLQLLAEDGEMALECDPKQWNPITVSGLEICRQKIYGNTTVIFYQLASLFPQK
ncbi:MAG: 16S rRNA (guanine(966)-N(2))-methyltransferase RsmD [Prochloraceae cyanobacterium]|nr:16S rRNA (guanine(966)-N(2))-methyltransferase RsmD [Prochloraceae cyanobacterium]